MKKKALYLENFKVSSFVTNILPGERNTVKGGTSENDSRGTYCAGCGDTDPDSIIICPSVIVHICVPTSTPQTRL